MRAVRESLDYVCAERLTPQLLTTARHLATFGELALPPAVEAHLAQISRATVARLLRPLPRPTPRLPRKGPQEANHLRRAVAMGRLPWQVTEPGYGEVDPVHHCGESAAGEYVHTLQLVDIATGWSERVAILGPGQAPMERGFRRILARLPFPLVHLHPDNGSASFNNHPVRFFGEAITGLTLTRSRPYQKNDSRFVEQKNYSPVHAYLGSRRLDTPPPRRNARPRTTCTQRWAATITRSSPCCTSWQRSGTRRGCGDGGMWRKPRGSGSRQRTPFPHPRTRNGRPPRCVRGGNAKTMALFLLIADLQRSARSVSRRMAARVR